MTLTLPLPLTLIKYMGLELRVVIAQGIIRWLPGRRALVVVFIKNMLFEIIAFVVFECL